MLSSIFIILSAISNALMDTSAENRFHDNKYNKDLGQNNDENKWKQPLVESSVKPFYYLGIYRPKYVESFPYSSTILVSLTDSWHKFKLAMLLFFCLAIVTYSPISTSILAFIGIKSVILTSCLDCLYFGVLFSFCFEVTYKKLYEKLKK